MEKKQVIEDGFWWATSRKDTNKGVVVVQVKENMWVEEVGQFDRTLVDMWTFLDQVNKPAICQEYTELKKKAIDMKENLRGRIGVWMNWLERNQDLIDVGRGFVYRLGFEGFVIDKFGDKITVAYHRYISDDHKERGTTGRAIPMKDWDVGIFDTWEKLFPRCFSTMEKVLRERWLRRDGLWDGGMQARYMTDMSVFNVGGGK